METDSYVDVVERLFREFDWALPLPEIAKLVGECRQDWLASTGLEGLEHTARQRLTDLSLSVRPRVPSVLPQRTVV